MIEVHVGESLQKLYPIEEIITGGHPIEEDFISRKVSHCILNALRVNATTVSPHDLILQHHQGGWFPGEGGGKMDAVVLAGDGAVHVAPFTILETFWSIKSGRND